MATIEPRSESQSPGGPTVLSILDVMATTKIFSSLGLAGSKVDSQRRFSMRELTLFDASGASITRRHRKSAL